MGKNSDWIHHKLFNAGVSSWNRWARTVISDEEIDRLKLSGNQKNVFKKIKPFNENEKSEITSDLGIEKFSDISRDIVWVSLPNKINLSFEEFIFPGEVSFSGMKFEKDVSFSKAVFCNEVTFVSAKFYFDVSFKDVEFCRHVKFNNTVFRKKVICDFVKFHCGVDFSGARFSGEAKFISTLFGDISIFRKTEFGGFAYFTESKFIYEVFFYEAIFESITYFDKIEFKDAVSFNYTEFKHVANFNSSIFLKSISFTNSKFQNSTNFKHVTFYSPPEFFNVDLHQDTSFCQAKYLDTRGDKGDSEGNMRAWRVLKLAMNKTHHHDQELMYFSFEMDAKSANYWFERSYINWFLVSCYKLFSGYGTSFVRPLVSLFVLWGGFALLYSYFMLGGIGVFQGSCRFF